MLPTALKFDDIDELVDTVNDMMRHFVTENAECVPAKELGLDSRCGELWVTANAIICDDDPRNLNYYGGGEYVESESVVRVGDYTVYMDTDERVQEWLNNYRKEEC